MPKTVSSGDSPRRQDPDGPAAPARVPIPKAPDDDPTPMAAAPDRATQPDDTFVFAPGLAPFDLPPFDAAYAMGRAEDAFEKGNQAGALTAPCEGQQQGPEPVPRTRGAEPDPSSRVDMWLDEDELLEILGPAQANYGGAI